jgi:hypothetical protein
LNIFSMSIGSTNCNKLPDSDQELQRHHCS